MLRMLFFFMGVPMMIMSFFNAVDVLPYATDFQVMTGGEVVELTIDQQAELKAKVETLFENSCTMPAFGVVTPEIYEEQIKDGVFVSIKFDQVFSINDLPFDELVFNVQKDFSGFNLLRGNKGVFQGRCIYLSIEDGNMDDLFDFLMDITAKQEMPRPGEVQIEQEEEKISQQ